MALPRWEAAWLGLSGLALDKTLPWPETTVLLVSNLVHVVYVAVQGNVVRVQLDACKIEQETESLKRPLPASTLITDRDTRPLMVYGRKDKREKKSTK